MDRHVFDTFRSIVYEHSGIYLNETKEAMITARIAKRMRVLGINDYQHYLQFLLHDQTGDEIVKFLDVIATNVTSFFREPEHFDVLGDLISQWIMNGRDRIRIWSAASSTGQEPYSIAMTAILAAGSRAQSIRILATDISTKALNIAKAGVYSSLLLEGVPNSVRSQFFIKKKSNNEVLYQIKDFVRKMVLFKRLNLSKPPFFLQTHIDIIFCRNVMIYFDNIVRTRLINELYRLLNPGGYLFVGHAESLACIKTDFTCLKPSIYQKPIIS
ncbi:MAG: protein-glutamate O-methyltransferase CheR [Desulfobacterota bacterium]|nr:protein-glutamate O-methyltransferase CheR [Thermodesulfobacteriota bacterium]